MRGVGRTGGERVPGGVGEGRGSALDPRTPGRAAGSGWKRILMVGCFGLLGGAVPVEPAGALSHPSGIASITIGAGFPAHPSPTQDVAPDTIRAAVDSVRMRILDRVRDLTGPAPPAPGEAEVTPGNAEVDTVPPAPVQTEVSTPRRTRSPGAELPTGADSIMQALAQLPGFTVATYQGLRGDYEARERRLTLSGTEEEKARFSGQGVRLEADSSIVYDDRTGRVRTRGSTLLTPDEGEPVRSRSLVYDVATERGTAMDAQTSYMESGFEWRVRGDLDSVQDGLLFGSRTRFTSSESDPPRSFFEASELKVVQEQVLIARSVRLYFDNVEEGRSNPVPVVWLPFIAQPLQTGRSSGLLTPRFSMNDVVRTSSGSDRRVSNMGYYWAMSDYSDVTMAMDWWSDRYVAMTGGLRYRWARQFLQGDASMRRFWRATGQREFAISTRNNWDASERTKLRASGNYVTNTGIVRQNSLDPRELTGSVDSQAGLDHRFQWGALSVSSSRKQFLNDDRVEMTLPSASLSLSTLTLFAAPPAGAQWYNNLSVNGSTRFERSIREFAPLADTVFRFNQADQVRTSANARATSSLGNLSLSGNVRYQENLFPEVPRFLVDPTIRPEEGEDDGAAGTRTPFFITPSRVGGQVADVFLPGELNPLTGERVDFSDARTDWDVSLSYQQRLIGATTLTPSLSIGGAMARVDSIADARSFVSGPNRVSMGLSAQTEIFGFYPGFGPFEALRHKVTPGVSWSYSPSTTPSALQEQVFGSRNLRVQNQLTFSFNQTWEARRQEPEEPEVDPEEPDEAPLELVEDLPLMGEDVEEEILDADPPIAPPARDRDEGEDGPRRLPPSRVVTLLGLSTSAVSYDIVQADSTGRFVDGFTTTQLSNTVRSDYLRGLDLSFTHSLFEEPALGNGNGAERRLAPHLEQLSLGFSMNDQSGVVQWVGGLLGLDREPREAPPAREDDLDDELADPFAGVDGFDSNRVLPGASGATRGRVSGRREGWDARVSYSLRRPRDSSVGSALRAQMVSATLSFAPTENWDATWQTSYDVEENRFNDHVVRLSRDLQEWEASFGFRQTALGNWSFQFEVSLKANRDLRFDHEQRSVGERGDGFGRTPF